MVSILEKEDINVFSFPNEFIELKIITVIKVNIILSLTILFKISPPYYLWKYLLL